MITSDLAADSSGALLRASFIWLPRQRRSVGVARSLLREFLAETACSDALLPVGELVLSELATNAIEHACAPPGRLIAVRFEMVADRLRLEVHDASRSRPAVQPAVGSDDESGRGLWLVESLAAEWGCSPRTGGVGKFVWALIAPVEGES